MNTLTQPDCWYHHIPKVELHLHLEGAIPLDALWQLIQKYGGDPEVPDLAALQARFTYRDFPHFIATWVWKNGFLRQYEDFTFIAEAAGRDLAAQNIRYVEAFFSPGDFARHGLRPQALAAAIRRGLQRVPEVRLNLIADLVRNYGPVVGERTLAEVLEARDQGIIGIGIGGSEEQFPPEPYQAVYALARRSGLHTTAHAGEAASAASIWGALRALGAERLGHATRAFEDPALLDFLAEQQTPLEMCPLSNVRTGVVAELAAHPIRRYYERGLLVTVNTDDPKMFNNSLAEEYQLLETVHGFQRAEICQLIDNAIHSSWLPPEEKQSLVAEFHRSPHWVSNI